MLVDGPMSTARCVIAWALLLIPGARAAEYWPAQGNMGQLCIERFEDNGSRNVVPVTVVIGDDGDRATLASGGESVCFYLYPQRYRVNLAWQWDRRDPPWRNYASAASRVDVSEFKLTVREVCAGRNPKGNYPVWVLMPRGGCGKLYEKLNGIKN